MMDDPISGGRRKQRQRSLGWLYDEAIAGLHGPAYRYKTHTKQIVKGSYRSAFPGIRQAGNRLASQVRHPMAHTG
jgi:hypothetical protein